MHVNSFTELNKLNKQTREFSEPSRVPILKSFAEQAESSQAR